MSHQWPPGSRATNGHPASSDGCGYQLQRYGRIDVTWPV